MFPFLTWGPLRAPVALASTELGKWGDDIGAPGHGPARPLGGLPPALLLLRRDQQGLGLVVSSEKFNSRKEAEPVRWMVHASQWKNSLQAGARQCGGGVGRAARGRRGSGGDCGSSPAF